MTIPQAIDLATNQEFRAFAGLAAPIRMGRVTAIEASGQVRVLTDDADGEDALAWPLNGFIYAINDVVFIATPQGTPDSAIVIGSKAPLPAADHTHAPYIKKDGSTPLTADWDIGDTRKLIADILRARDAAGLSLEDDDGNLGVFVKDGGNVGIHHNNPQFPFDLAAGDMGANATIAQYAGHPNAAGNAYTNYYHDGNYSTANAMILELDLNVNNAGTNQRRAAMQYIASFDDITNATRNSLVRIGTAIAGIFGTAIAITGKTLGLFNAATSPQGIIHAHNGVTGLLFVSKTGIVNSAQTIIPNAAGDIVHGLSGLAVATDGTYAAAGTFNMYPGGTEDFAAGTLTLRLTCAADGSLTVIRQAGTGSGTLALLGLWL